MTGTGIQPYGDDGRLLCLECGRPFQLLAPHLGPAHGMSSAEYREAHQLPRRLSLRTTALAQRASAQGRDRYQQRPDIRASLEAGRKDAPETSAVDSSRETALRPMVRQARRRGGQGKATADRRRMAERMHAAGFTDLDTYLAARRGMTISAMARELDLPRATLNGWIRRATGDQG
ncbi:MucR family transcriptional regulator [Streptomyces olivoreticuli]|uniref:MucR family transcriptional regulator n=1 Tax=Streptomyces olivoreticuli TaxID=68246 RepID=UPI002658A48D|nr:MucR family transcriptional regulator [Streptomyces olivoreticuli]WKK24141.1 MucR family transcriptional regulator [Streptomyces olivoreticuli]